MESEIRDSVVLFVNTWTARTGIETRRMIKWIELSPEKYYDWKTRLHQDNHHNGLQPRAFWLLPWEKEAIIAYAIAEPMQGYRRLSYMMLDADVVAVSPSSVYRVLKCAGLLQHKSTHPSKKGTGFNAPNQAHKHWHIDISYINIAGTFYYLCAILDGYSRFIVLWDIREQMRERDVEIIIERAREQHPEEAPRIITDNGPQFIARDFKLYIRLMGMTHVRTSPYYPQSNGKIERWHQTLKRECIRPNCPISLSDAHNLVTVFVHEYNHERLHSAIGYITPNDKIQGRADAIFATRREKLDAASQARCATNGQSHADAV